MAFKMKGSSYKMGGVKTKSTMAYMKSPMKDSKSNYNSDGQFKKLEESQKTGSYSIQQSEIPMMRKGRILIDNMTDNIQNIGLLEDSAEMGYALQLCLKTEILFYLKHDDSIDEVAAYKYSSDQFSIEENLYSQIIKVFVVKFKNGDCEMMALPFFRR